MKTIPCCLICGIPISWGVHLLSRRIYGHSLCIKDQCCVEESGASARVVDLYLALKSLHIPVELRYFDGCQYVDIALPERLYIKVKSPGFEAQKQSLKDLCRDIDADGQQFLTILISQFILENPDTFELAVNEIAKVCQKVLKKPLVTGLRFSFSSAQWQ